MDWIKRTLESPEPIKWLFTGDSITHGALHTFGSRDYVQIFEERLRYEMGRPRDFVIKTAISGWSTQSIRDDIDWNILQFEPDVVSIMIGMNDAYSGVGALGTFTENYNFILDKASQFAGERIIIHTPNPILPGSTPDREPHLPHFVDRVREIAEKRGLLLIDHFSEWNRLWDERVASAYEWMADGIHPGEYGHRVFARLLLKNLGMWDETSYSGRLYVP